MEPAYDLVRALVRWEYGVKHGLDDATPHDECQTLYQPHAPDFKSRKVQRLAEFEFRIAQQLEGQVQALRHLSLIVGRLRAEAEHVRPKLGQFSIMVPEPAGLRRASPSARDHVPAVRQRFPWHASHGIAVDDRPC